ncbi:hypothetical protein F5878DRAFT_666457 [Lentinula raphanica]|uniref:Uncharacterized protein n=1 Tax=Lentinula raphanica TaxID=153919 RepID=A0AA38UBA5_9AGAR|nr:hypothetical protein F5878DRAFT_666457 [Lentinula raphanica]
MDKGWGDGAGQSKDTNEDGDELSFGVGEDGAGTVYGSRAEHVSENVSSDIRMQQQASAPIRVDRSRLEGSHDCLQANHPILHPVIISPSLPSSTSTRPAPDSTAPKSAGNLPERVAAQWRRRVLDASKKLNAMPVSSFLAINVGIGFRYALNETQTTSTSIVYTAFLRSLKQKPHLIYTPRLKNHKTFIPASCTVPPTSFRMSPSKPIRVCLLMKSRRAIRTPNPSDAQP